MTNENPENKNKKAPVLLMIAAVAVVLGGFWVMDSMKTNTPLDVVQEEIITPAEPEQAEIVKTYDLPSEESIEIDVTKMVGVRALGDLDAPIKIIEYASLTCSHCAHFHNDILPVLKEKYIDKGLVYLEFREFPLNDPALKATITARCLPEDKYQAFVGLLFKTQDQWADGVNYMLSLKQNAKLAGLSDEQFDACHNNGDLKLAIANQMQEGQDKYKIQSTPTFIVNDGVETIGGAVPIEEFERVFRKVSGDKIGVVPDVK